MMLNGEAYNVDFVLRVDQRLVYCYKNFLIRFKYSYKNIAGKNKYSSANNSVHYNHTFHVGENFLINNSLLVVKLCELCEINSVVTLRC